MARERSRARVREARERLHRELLLGAAERCFAEKGVDDTKMEEISRESGLSLAAIYELVPGKAALVRQVHEARLSELLERTIAASRGRERPFEQLLAGVRAAVDHFMLHPSYLRMHLRDGHAWGLRGAMTTRSAAIGRWWSRAVEWMVPIFEAGIRRGEFHADDPALMARRANALVQVQMASWLEGDGVRGAEATLADLGEQLRRAFCRPAVPPRPRRAGGRPQRV
jgi:AcrR family transcriptional regulator